MEKKKKKEKVNFGKAKLINLSYIVVLFNPIPAGIILGYILRTNKSTRKDGNLIMILSGVWGIVNLILTQRLLGL